MAALDYYELLEVAHLRGASFDADELKRAYRRLALQWHPDKHAAAGAAEQLRATEHFKLVQNAYAVLGDDAERAWYDTHAGVAPGASEVAAGLVNIFALFSQAAYDGFADGEARGFYCVYGAAFASIVAEEAKYADAAAGTGGGPAPPLGDSRTQPGEVSAFYAFWGGFSSRMHFGWADEHDPREGRNRAERRFMEKENEALRRAARRARSEDVRALADFVRKRDKRVILQQIEAQRKAEEAEARRRATLAAAAAAAAELRAGQAAADRERLAAREAEISASGHFRLADFDNGDEAGDASRARGNRRRRGAPPSGEGGGESAVPRIASTSCSCATCVTRRSSRYPHCRRTNLRASTGQPLQPSWRSKCRSRETALQSRAAVRAKRMPAVSGALALSLELSANPVHQRVHRVIMD